jgi:iron complex outermembrane receptor protein
MLGLFFAFNAIGYAQSVQNLPSDGENQSTLIAGEVEELEAVQVTAKAEAPLEARPRTVVEGDVLRGQIANTLGKTLEQELGVRNASFGPGVGVPVVRGLTGSRIRTLQDGIGSHDAAAVSPDHAVALEPLLADKIEILRGPATVRFGSGAIGGAVNVVDGRIPVEVPKNGVAGAAEFRYGSNGGELAGVAKANAGEGPFAVHLDGFYRTRSNLRVPGFAIDRAAVEGQFGLTQVPSVRGFVPNTDLETGGGSLGWSVSGEPGLVGMAVSHLVNEYGIPTGGHGLGHSHGGTLRHGEKVRVDMNQTRYDFKAEWFEPLPFVDAAILRIGLVDYEHSEVDLGVRSTTFRNDTLEGRFELTTHPLGPLTGAVGIQWIDREFSAVGKETFVPPTEIGMVAGYLTQRLEWGDWSFDLGVRKEQQITEPTRTSLSLGGLYNIPLPSQLKFSPHSASGGVDWRFAEGWLASFNYSWAERAPDVQELLSIGPHLATRTFDVGNVALGTEASHNFDLGIAGNDRNWEAKFNGFYNSVGNYIYLRNLSFFFDSESERFQLRCAQLDRCLPAYGYSQGDARFFGYEAEASLMWPDSELGAFKWTLFSDFVRGRFVAAGAGDVPRLPTLRYGGQIALENGEWRGSARLTRAEPQNRPGNNETETPGYLMLSANLNYRVAIGEGSELQFFVRGDNLLNQKIRNSVSFLRSFSPEAGLNVEIGLRATF